MLSLQRWAVIVPRIYRNRLPSSVTYAIRCHTQSSFTTLKSPIEGETTEPTSSTTPGTLIGLAVKKDVDGILLELENMLSSSSSIGSSSINSSDAPTSSANEESSENYAPKLAALVANMFFNDKVSTVNISSIEQCCDIFDLLDEKHPVLAQQGYSKLLELTMSKDYQQLVCRLCSRLIAQDVRLEKAHIDSLVGYLTTRGEVAQALALAQTVPVTRQIIFSLAEPLLMSHQHMVFADLFKQFCSPFNNGSSLTDVNLAIISMMWAHALAPPQSEADRDEFVASITNSLDSYKAVFHDMVSRDATYNRRAVSKLFCVMKDALHHVFLCTDPEDREDTARVLASLRRKFVTSHYFCPFPFLPPDCSDDTNFSPSVSDITAQLGGRAETAFFLSNSLWPQDYADTINNLVGEREDINPFYDGYDDGDVDSDSDSDSEYDSSIEEGASSSDSDSDSSEEGTEYSINIGLDITATRSLTKDHSKCMDLFPKVCKLVDMDSYLSRCREELPHAREDSSQEDREEAMRSFVSGFQIDQKINLLVQGAMLSGERAGGGNNAGSCPHILAVCRKMQTLGYVDEDDVTLNYSVADISKQCRLENIRLAGDLFGYGPLGHVSEGPYESIKYMKDEINWDAWTR